MAKNIVIFSDGTGQRGGVMFDERRSNIYKLYRATRCGPDSSVDPRDQFAFYDAGIGTVPAGIGFFGAIWQWIYNIICQATGLGLTENIIDCYVEIIRHWEPGDRIYLFGFSRGAYTVRCLAAVLSFCGVPTQMSDGRSLLRSEAEIRKIAYEAVTKVYQHVSSPRDKEFLPQRQAIAARFRMNYGSGAGANANTYPHFVGVFDTVAAIASWGSMAVVLMLWITVVVALSLVMWAAVGGFWPWVIFLVGTSIVVAMALYFKTHIKVAFGLAEFRWWRTLHLTDFRMKFYDTQLNINVGWARHALAIDEHRKDFDRVPWGTPNDWRKVPNGEPGWFKQEWFAGNHSDIGGSYSEPESRLSDISLSWMLNEAVAVPGGLQVDQSVLKTYPSASGIQHDETRSFIFKFTQKINRQIKPNAILHQSVIDRFNEKTVLHFDELKPYRPEALRLHQAVCSFYGSPSEPS